MAFFGLSAVMFGANLASAQVTGPADASRIRPEERVAPLLPEEADAPTFVTPTPQAPKIPEISDKRPFTLTAVKIEGETAFSEAELADIYQPYIGQKVTLEAAYVIAAKITERYRNAGYFLSLASVMDRDLKTGIVKIKITEGYIGEVELKDPKARNHVVEGYIKKIKATRPIGSRELESFLLRLNDLPGMSFRAVLAKAGTNDEAAVKLVLIPSNKQGRGAISFDNYGSRFLGPNEVIATYSTSLFDLGQTTVSAIGSVPLNELKSGTIEQTYMVAPDITVGVSASTTHAEPGYTLKPFDVESDSSSLDVFLKYQLIRQRQENLSTKLAFGGRHSTTDILGVPFTRDDIRAVRASMNFDRADSWRGVLNTTFTLTQGIDGLGSSEAGELTLSRAQAKPDFTKAELSISRLQAITNDWTALFSASGQYASGPLFSSEEYGYGGQSFGRAYDSSEITGDHGVSAAVELRYSGWSNPQPVGIEPYAFYDMGVVWNDDIAQPSRDSGMSAGGGVRATTDFGMSGNLGLAYPLTREISAPIYGTHKKGPRIILQASQAF